MVYPLPTSGSEVVQLLILLLLASYDLKAAVLVWTNLLPQVVELHALFVTLPAVKLQTE